MSIRWKRDFFRAWIVFAVLWIVAAALIIRSSKLQDPFDGLAPEWQSQFLLPDPPMPTIRTRGGCEEMAEWAAKELPTYPYDLEACVRTAYERNWEDFGKLMWMFLPPGLILIFGSAVARTIQGFRSG